MLCLLNLWCIVLNQIDYVNIALQTKNQTLDVAVKMLNGLIKSIQEIRENGFQKCLCEAKDMAKSLNISSEFTNKRKLITERTTVELKDRENKSYESTENKFRAQCFEALDSILSSLCWRFEKMSQIEQTF